MGGNDAQDSAKQGAPETRMRRVAERCLSPGVVDVGHVQRKYDRAAGFAQKTPMIDRLLSRSSYADATTGDSGGLVFSNSRRERHDGTPVVARGSYASPETGFLREPAWSPAAAAAGSGPTNTVLQKKETTDHPDQSPSGYEAKEQLSKKAPASLSNSPQKRVQRRESPGVIDTRQARKQYERTTPLAAQRTGLISRLASRWTQADDGLEQNAGPAFLETGTLRSRVSPIAQQESPGLASVAADQPGNQEGLGKQPLARAATGGESFLKGNIARVVEQSLTQAVQRLPEANSQGKERRDASGEGSEANGEKSAPVTHFSPTNGYRLSRKKTAVAAGSGIDGRMHFVKPDADAPKTEKPPEARQKAATGNVTIQTAGLPSWTDTVKETASEGKRPVQHNSEALLVVRRKIGKADPRRAGEAIQPENTEVEQSSFSSAQREKATHHPFVHRSPAPEAVIQRQILQQAPASAQGSTEVQAGEDGSTAVAALRDSSSTAASSPLPLRQAFAPKGSASPLPISSTRTMAGSNVVHELRVDSAPLQKSALIWRTSAEHSTTPEAFPFETRSRNQALPLNIGARPAGDTVLLRQVARATAEAPAAENATTADVGRTPQVPVQAGGVDVSLLAEQVSRLLSRQLETERERRGVGL